MHRLFCLLLIFYGLSFDLFAKKVTMDNLFDLSLEDLLKVQVHTGQRSSSTSYRKLPVPIHIITRTELEASGYTELGKVLQRHDNSFNFPRTNITDLSDHARPASLRGLSPAHTLILINGKRLHHSAVLHINNSMGRGSTSADINTIPIAAIEHIEILQDGAGAQYGSDAIAGVVNIILAKSTDTFFSTTLGQTEAGDGNVGQADFTIGNSFSSGGSWQATFELRERDQTNRSEGDNRQQYFDGDPRNDVRLFNQQQYGDPDASDRLFWVNGEYRLTGQHQLYFHGGWNGRRSDSPAFFRRPLDNRNVRVLYPDGFLPMIRAEIDDINATIGVANQQQTAESWDWDISATLGQNQLQASVNNTVNVSLGGDSPTHFDAGQLLSKQLMFAGQITRTFMADRWTMDTFVGVEWRKEFYQIEAGEAASYSQGAVPILDGPNAGKIANAGSQGFSGFMPNNAIDVDRTNIAFYGESKLQWDDDWLVQLAARYEQYSDFGSNVDGKLALAYTPSDHWLWRASLGTGFRAPSLAQSSYRATSTSFFENESFDTGTFGVDEPVSQALGATELKPENSLHAGAGFAYYGIDNFIFSFDYFSTKIQDRIVLSGAITRDEVVFGSQVVNILNDFGLDGVRFFSNSIDTRTQGGDIKMDYDYQWTDAGKLHVALHYHHNSSIITDGPRSSQILSHSVDVLFDRREQKRISDGQPGDNLLFSINYEMDDWKAEWRQMRFGKITTAQRDNDPSHDFTYGSRWVTDVDFSYQLDSRLNIAVGAHNLFGKQPAYRDEIENPLFGEGKLLPYHQLSPFGFNGAFYYFRATYQF